MYLARQVWENPDKLQAAEPHSKDVVNYMEELKSKPRTAIEASRENAEAAQRVQKFYYDQKSRARKLSVDEKILILQPSSTSKMLAQYVGPYESMRCLDFDNYEIQLERRKTVLHINVLI